MKYLITLPLALTLSGCAMIPFTGSDAEPQPEPSKYTQKLRSAPFWVSNPLLAKDSDLAAKSGVRVSLAAKGMAVVRDNNIPLAYEEAMQDGRSRLAELIRTEVEKEIEKDYRRFKRDGVQITDDDLRVMSRSVTSMNIQGALPLEDWTSDDDVMYVLMVLDPENLERIKQTALRKILSEENVRYEKDSVKEYVEEVE